MSGFIYTFEGIDTAGNVKWSEVVENIIPTAAQNYFLESALNNGVRYTAWYIGIYGNNYAPLAADTMASFSVGAGEITTYDEAARPTFVADAISAGLYANFATPAEFTMNAGDTIYGGFIASSAVKGGTTGLLLSAALFSSPRTLVSGEGLRVKAGVQLGST